MSTTPSDPPADESAPAPSAPPAAGSHLKHRAAAAVLIAASLAGAYFARSIGQPELQAVFGIPGFIGLAYLFSTAPNRVNWRTVVAGLALQFTLAFLILRVSLVYQGFELIGGAIQKFLDFTNEGASFVFGPMASAGHPGDVYGAIGGGPAVEISHNRIPPRPFLFAFQALPAVIFVSSFFTVLYHLGVLQFVVKWLARGVVIVMGTSGAETLSAVANVFMGQTEAPLIVKPYVLKMTRSELLALMVGGMATISGGVMVAYIGMMTAAGFSNGAVSILATSVMAAPAGLYLAKILVPETEEPETRGVVKTQPEKPDANVFDAAARGASEGMNLVLNIAAMLIAFIAFIAMTNHLIKKANPAWSLEAGFAQAFGPAAVMMGVPADDVPKVAELLGTKLVLNEFVAYTVLTGKYKADMDPRSFALSVFALTGFANFSSIGIQLGGIGAMAPSRRGDLARLGPRALLGGFLATLVNAAVAGLLM
jgi:concentrative nucleoside transporter, CNT family